MKIVIKESEVDRIRKNIRKFTCPDNRRENILASLPADLDFNATHEINYWTIPQAELGIILETFKTLDPTIEARLEESMIRGFTLVSQKIWGDTLLKIPAVVKDVRMHQELEIPRAMTKGSAGYDFISPWDFRLEPGESVTIPSGVRAYMQEDEVLKIYARSGLGFKYFCRLANGTGIIDSDYWGNPQTEGHIFVRIRNEGDMPMELKRGDGYAQGIFEKKLRADGEESHVYAERVGGMGSTDSTAKS